MTRNADTAEAWDRRYPKAPVGTLLVTETRTIKVGETGDRELTTIEHCAIILSMEMSSEDGAARVDVTNSYQGQESTVSFQYRPDHG